MSLAGQIENQSDERQDEMSRDFNGANDQQEVSNSNGRRSNRGFAAMSPERQK